MSAPLSESRVAPAGSPLARVVAGKYRDPEWLRAITPGTWGTVGSHTLAEINPQNNPLINPAYPAKPEFMAITGWASIVTAWNGGDWNEVTQSLELPLQGGHADCACNDPLRQTLSVDSPVWRRLRYPSGAIGNLLTTDDGQEATGVYSDGRPRAIHSYNAPIVVPGYGSVISCQGSTSWSGATGTRDLLLIGEDGECQRKAAAPSVSGYATGQGACYDPSRHAIWYRGSGTANVCKFDVATEAWATVGPQVATSGNIGLEYLPEGDCLFIACQYYTRGFSIFDCVTGTSYQPTVTGALVGLTLSGYCRPRWVESLGAIAVWDNTSNTTLINILTPTGNPRTDPWAISQITPIAENAVTPTVRASNGTYGRFFYSKRYNGFGVFNSVNQPTYFYRMAT